MSGFGIKVWKKSFKLLHDRTHLAQIGFHRVTLLDVLDSVDNCLEMLNVVGVTFSGFHPNLITSFKQLKEL